MNGSDLGRRENSSLIRLISQCLGPMVLSTILASIVVSQLGVTVTSAVTSACIAAGLICAAILLAGLMPSRNAAFIAGLLTLVLECSSIYGQDIDRMLQASLAAALLLAVLQLRPVTNRLLSGISEPVRIGMLASFAALSISYALRLCGIVDSGDEGSLALAGVFDPVFVDALVSLLATAILCRCSAPAASLLGILIATFAGIPLGLTQAPSGVLALPDFSLVMASSSDLANSLMRIPSSLSSPEMAGLVGSMALCLLVLTSDGIASALDRRTRFAVTGLLMAITSFLGFPGLCVSSEDTTGCAADRFVGAILAFVLMLALSACSPLVACVPVPAVFGPILLVFAKPLRALERLDFNDLACVLPVVGMIACALVTGSLAWAVAAGLLLDLGLKLGNGELRKLSWVTMALDLLALAYVLAATGL